MEDSMSERRLLSYIYLWRTEGLLAFSHGIQELWKAPPATVQVVATCF